MAEPTQGRKPYPSNVTDEQWTLLEPLLPKAKTGARGRRRKVSMRAVVDAILYVNRTGCQWEMLPRDFPPKSTVFEYFSRWSKDGTWVKVLDALRERVRIEAGKEPTPSAVCIDSQSVKTTEVGGSDRGYDGGKKIAGRKRHWVVDTLGLLVAVAVTGAGVDDGVAAPALLEQLKPKDFPRLEVIFGDSKYHNHNLHAWIDQHRPGWRIEVKRRPEGTKGFAVLPKRWVVERTNAWNGRSRRNSKDYERTVVSSAAMIRVSNIHRMLRRLAPAARPKFNYVALAA